MRSVVSKAFEQINETGEMTLLKVITPIMKTENKCNLCQRCGVYDTLAR